MCVFCLTRYILGRGLWWNSNKTSISQCFTYLCILSCYWIIGSSFHCRSYNILWWSQTDRQIENKGVAENPWNLMLRPCIACIRYDQRAKNLIKHDLNWPKWVTWTPNYGLLNSRCQIHRPRAISLSPCEVFPQSIDRGESLLNNSPHIYWKYPVRDFLKRQIIAGTST